MFYAGKFSGQEHRKRGKTRKNKKKMSESRKLTGGKVREK
jgi:hypothetical protein